MEIFFSDNVLSDTLLLSAEDSSHCARVLRHRIGDSICVVDGKGTMYECRITSLDSSSPSRNVRLPLVEAVINERHPKWNGHPYDLTMAVCPTKNTDRYEWFIEKAVEIGVDSICPIVGERSQRRVFKTDRAGKIVLSAMKQSLKSVAPVVEEPVAASDFIRSKRDGLKFIAYCFEDGDSPRISLPEALRQASPDCVPAVYADGNSEVQSGKVPGVSLPRTQITILIGPEGDFSSAEAELAMQNGYVPIHLGPSRLRTETAAVVAVSMVYSSFFGQDNICICE